MHIAALWNRPLVMELLIRLGAELNLTNLNGQTPLDIAMHWCHYDIAEVLQHFGTYNPMQHNTYMTTQQWPVGAKHSYEQERDVAVAQRDVYKGQIEDARKRTETALADSITYRRKYEEMRLEKERTENFHAELLAETKRAEQRADQSENEVARLIKTHDRLQLEIMNLKDYPQWLGKPDIYNWN